MKILGKITGILLLTFILLASGCGENSNDEPILDVRKPDEAFLKCGEDYSDIVELTKINDWVWVHTSYYEGKDMLMSQNGLVVITDKGLVLINAPCSGNQMNNLEKLALEHFNAGFLACIITNAQADNTDGLSFLTEKAVGITCLDRVANKANDFFKPDHVLNGEDTLVMFGDVSFELYYPGEGYSDHNTTVWIDKYNLLFAGNMVKEHGAYSLGNSEYINLDAWPESLNNILRRYDNIEIVVPGHGQWGDASLIDYTLGLFEE